MKNVRYAKKTCKRLANCHVHMHFTGFASCNSLRVEAKIVLFAGLSSTITVNKGDREELTIKDHGGPDGSDYLHSLSNLSERLLEFPLFQLIKQ